MPKKSEKKDISIRSSAAEYLTFVAATGDDKSSVEVRYEDEKYLDYAENACRPLWS